MLDPTPEPVTVPTFLGCVLDSVTASGTTAVVADVGVTWDAADVIAAAGAWRKRSGMPSLGVARHSVPVKLAIPPLTLRQHKILELPSQLLRDILHASQKLVERLQHI